MKKPSFFRTWWYAFQLHLKFMWALFRGFFGKKGQWHEIGKALGKGKTYELGKIGYPTVMKVQLQLLESLIKKRVSFSPDAEGAQNVGLYDSGDHYFKQRGEYLDFFAGEKPGARISWKQLLGSSYGLHGILLCWAALHFLPLSLFAGLFPKIRTNAALWSSEYIRCLNLLLIAKTEKLDRLYYFCIFIKEANFTARALMSKGVEVIKVTSESPLTFWNRAIVADKVRICFAYQEEEAQAFSETIFCKDIETWGPEQSLGYIHRYLDRTNPPPGTLGIYTSGAWRRKQRGDTDAGLGYYESEDILLDDMKAFVESHPEVEVIIFPHPIEKDSHERYEEAKKLYRDRLGPNARFADAGTRSDETFEQADVAVSVFSTVMYERLFCGYKSLMAPYKIKGFPLEGSGVDRISARNREALFALLEEALQMDTDYWFMSKGIENYVLNGDPERFSALKKEAN